jgi:lysophospholipase L1-like esterase
MIPTRPILIPVLLLAFICAAHADFNLVWPLPQPPPGTARATFPQPRMDWLGRFLGNLDKLKDGPYDLIFDGDSITDNWQGSGKDVWKAHYGAIKAADFGIGGDQVQHVLWRLQNGELKGQNPKLIMLMIGTNNGGEDPKEIADGIKLLLNEYETQCPAAHILLLGVFPRGAAANTPVRDWVAKINALISTYDDGKRVTYLDIGSKFLQPDGTITSEIMPDFLHPSAKGYEIWAGAIQPVIDKYFPPVAAPAK